MKPYFPTCYDLNLKNWNLLIYQLNGHNAMPVSSQLNSICFVEKLYKRGWIQLNSVCERERQIRKSYVYFSMNCLNDLCLCVFSFTAVLCCSALLTVFLFVSRAFISGAFQGAYIYTPEVKIGSFYLLGQRELWVRTLCSSQLRTDFV